MSTINNLPTRTPQAGDLLPFYSSGNGDAAKMSLTALSTLMASLLGTSYPLNVTQYKTITGNDGVTITSSTANTWLIVTPTNVETTPDLTVTFPSYDAVTDMTEITVSVSDDVSLIVSATGATFYSGTTISMTPDAAVKFRFDKVNTAWHRVA